MKGKRAERERCYRVFQERDENGLAWSRESEPCWGERAGSGLYLGDEAEPAGCCVAGESRMSPGRPIFSPQSWGVGGGSGHQPT